MLKDRGHVSCHHFCSCSHYIGQSASRCTSSVVRKHSMEKKSILPARSKKSCDRYNLTLFFVAKKHSKNHLRIGQNLWFGLGPAWLVQDGKRKGDVPQDVLL